MPRPLRDRFVRPKFIPLILFLGGFGLNMVMGSWQVQRLHWKEHLIAQVEEANRTAPLTELPSGDTDLKTLQFTRVNLRGAWLGDTEFHLAPRYYKSTLGYNIIAPFKLPDGRMVLVNRGWVPTEKKLAETRQETKTHGKASITGLIRVGSERNPFTPANQPARNIWFGRDVAEMAGFAHLENTAPMMVDLIGPQDGAHLPVPSDGTVHLRNDHLTYIITWYSIALGILIIFVTYHYQKPEKP